MTAPRLAWLDALRGYAAVVVALFHLSPAVLGADRHLQIYRQFDFGKYGVLLFFLVSGYVIPMSLERHGSLRRFWTGRLFRIYPAYLFTIALAAVLAVTGMYRLPQQLTNETVASVLGHATMLQDLLGIRGIVGPFWTLAFEMIFYLLVAGLFAWRWHRFSVWWAAGLTVIALAGGGRLPGDLLGGSASARRVAAGVVLLLVIAGCGAYLRGWNLLAGASGIGLVALPLVNGHASRWVTTASSAQAALMLAVMFAGTVVHRAQHRQIRRRGAAATLTLVFAGVALHQWIGTGTGLLRWTATALAVALTFLIAFALRSRSFPAVLTRLGAISYSLYLLHVLVLGVIVRLTEDPLLIAFAFTAGTLSVAWAAHRWVELPGQALGRRIGERFPVIRIATQGGTPRTGSFGKQRESV